LDTVFARGNRGAGGRPPYDSLMMFKVLILQRYYNLSDAQTQFQILDRLIFMRFLGLQLSDRVPDGKTVWLLRQRLTGCGAVEELFAVILRSLEAAGLVGNEGRIVDASFVEVPRQRNNRGDNARIKAGGMPDGWESKPKMRAQKDLDARWTKKNNLLVYGYTNHGKVDAKSKLITKYLVTDASVHDSQALGGLLERKRMPGRRSMRRRIRGGSAGKGRLGGGNDQRGA
jgi:transposase, IS5 family